MSHIVCQDIGDCKVSDYNFVRRILVPYNDSKHIANVFGFALTLAKILGASILVASVVNKDLVGRWVNGTPSREKSLSLGSVDVIKKGIEKLQGQAKKFGIPFDSTIIPSKKVSDSLLTLINSQKVDLVIMGTKGNAMWKEMLMGRVSTTVGINAKCPVLLVK